MYYQKDNRSVQKPGANLPVPVDMDAERNVLGACLKSTDATTIALSRLDKDDFYSPANARIFQGIAELFSENKPLDVTTLSDKLGSTPHDDRISALNFCGGRLYVSSLFEDFATDKNCAYHCAIVKDKSTRRKLIQTGYELVRDATNEFRKTEETIISGEHRLLSCAGLVGDRNSSGQVSFFDRYDQPHQDTIITGFTAFDRVTDGLTKGEPVIIGARPSVGKTSLLLQMLRNIAKTGKKVLYFTYETTKEVLIDRMAVGELGLDRWQYRIKEMSPADNKKFADACAEGGALDIIQKNILIDESCPDIKRFPLSLRLYKNRFPFDIVFLDYIQLMAGSEDNIDVSKASKVISYAAKEHKVPVVVASQLHRQKEERYDPRPRLPDLRGSGALEQDARKVIFLWNPCSPLRQAIDLTESERLKVEEWRHKVRFILAKNSEGDVSEFDLAWDGAHSRFFSMENRRELFQ